DGTGARPAAVGARRRGAAAREQRRPLATAGGGPRHAGDARPPRRRGQQGTAGPDPRGRRPHAGPGRSRGPGSRQPGRADDRHQMATAHAMAMRLPAKADASPPASSSPTSPAGRPRTM
ncbi:MAG: hypothetical protein AVDCRST_MAG08-4097, partial [uncultured Acetobacteraceae bacterium]